MRDPYEVLSVSRDASADEIKSAFRRLAREHHPDVNQGNPESEERFKEIGQAYAVLSDPEKKARYDQFGTAEEIPSGNFQNFGDFADIFQMFFGNMAGGQSQRNVGRDGDDLRADIKLTLQEVITGVTKEVSYRRQAKCGTCGGKGTEGGVEPDVCTNCNGAGMVGRMQQTIFGTVQTSATCPTCRGAGTIIKKPCNVCRGQGLVVEEAKATVDIPAGIESGTRIQIPGKGSDGTGYGMSGGLYVFIEVEEDERFERHGQDVAMRLNLTFSQAAMGDEISVEGIDSDYDVEVPAGTQPGEYLRVQGAGLPPLHGGRRGDLVLVTNIAVPEKLTEGQIEQIKKLAEAFGEPIPKGSSGGGLLGGLFKKKR
ncbi:MAG: molecular chaperone DnaJ [Fimbriimonadaceae bacterium]|nr:molecular chaperone DnaJ [Fimbriimonadaceae bacterium]